MKLDIETNIVAKVLKSSILTRNDRKHLYNIVCMEELKEKGFSQENIGIFIWLLQSAPRESNVTRTAAFIQNQYNGTGIYKPNDKVRIGRKVKQEKCKTMYGIDYTEEKPKLGFWKRLFR